MKKAEKIINVIFSVGAAVVIYGALLKITHKPGADLFLSIGLYVEVFIFLIMAAREAFKVESVSQEMKKVAEQKQFDPLALTESINNLNRTIKKVFNQ
jgi:hypothetical protein